MTTYCGWKMSWESLVLTRAIDLFIWHLSLWILSLACRNGNKFWVCCPRLTIMQILQLLVFIFNNFCAVQTAILPVIHKNNFNISQRWAQYTVCTPFIHGIVHLVFINYLLDLNQTGKIHLNFQCCGEIEQVLICVPTLLQSLGDCCLEMICYLIVLTNFS